MQRATVGRSEESCLFSRNRRKRLALLAGALSCSVSTLPAAAQERQVEEVLVTAQKRSERQIDVPISISVVTPQLLESTNAKNLTELTGAVPGVMFNGNGGGGRNYIGIRGTTGSALNTGDEPVAIYLDDVYLARGMAIGTTDLLDVKSIEILRGPQGTLQGRNATAGAVLIRTADPTSTPEGYVNWQATTNDQYRMQAAASGPLGGGWTARVAAGLVKSIGWAKNTTLDTNIGGGSSAQGRAILAYAGDSPFTARIAADWGVITNQPALFRNALTNVNANPTLVAVTAPTPQTPLPPDQRARIYDDDKYTADPDTNTTLDVAGVSAKLNYAFADMDLVSVTGYRRTHVFGRNNSSGMATAPRSGFNNNDDRSDSFSQEVRLQSSGNKRFSWIVGAYYFYEDQDYADTIYNLRFSTAASTASFYYGNQTTDSYAAFADGTFAITDTVKLVGGVRYSEDKKKLNAGIRVTNTVTGAVTNTPYPASDSWDDVTWRAKLVYQPTPDLMFFAGYGVGFRAGGYNDFAVQPAFAPEEIKSYEGGVKADLFNRRFTASVTGYHNKYNNLQLRAGVPSGGAIITNAANSEISGFEAQLTARPFERTRIDFNAAYTDASFISFPRAVDIFNNFVNASGNSLPNAPKWQFYVSAAHDFMLDGGWMATAEANYRWRDKIYFYFTNQTDAPWQDSSGGILNARLTVTPPDDRWSVSLFGTNLANARIVQTDVVTFSYPEVSLNEPRSFGVSFRYRF